MQKNAFLKWNVDTFIYIQSKPLMLVDDRPYTGLVPLGFKPLFLAATLSNYKVARLSKSSIWPKLGVSGL